MQQQTQGLMRQENSILPLQASAQQASSNNSDKRGVAGVVATCSADSPGRRPASRNISSPPSGSGLGTRDPALCGCSGCPSESLVRFLPSSPTKVTICARHQLLNLAHTWAGLAWSRRVTSPPLASWRHPDLLPPPPDKRSLAGCLTQGTTQLAVRQRMELHHGGPLPPVKGLGWEPKGVSIQSLRP